MVSDYLMDTEFLLGMMTAKTYRCNYCHKVVPLKILKIEKQVQEK